jgi:hypothetical protein
MHWFRTHIRNGSTLALIALAIQMLLAFGHFHAGYALAAHGASIEHVQPPAPDHPQQHAAEHCDICAVISMAGTLLAASPPALRLPPVTDLVRVTVRADMRDLATIKVAFQPRAPPLS